MARHERAKHMQMYPGWSARDNYAIHKKRKKRKPAKEAEECSTAGTTHSEMTEMLDAMVIEEIVCSLVKRLNVHASALCHLLL